MTPQVAARKKEQALQYIHAVMEPTKKAEFAAAVVEKAAATEAAAAVVMKLDLARLSSVGLWVHLQALHLLPAVETKRKD